MTSRASSVYLSTFSIVARCPSTGRFGVAVASRAFACGSRCPAVRPNVGAVAGQAWIDPAIRWRLLDEISAGASASVALQRVLKRATGTEHCQLGVVDAHDGSAAHTGETTMPWAGHRIGRGYTTQGNLLAGPDVLARMEDAFVSSSGDLAGRLLLALEAGDAAGGDRRGRQSAALVVGDQPEFPYIDIRVDDHVQPLVELRRLYEVRQQTVESYDRWVSAVRAGIRVPLS